MKLTIICLFCVIFAVVQAGRGDGRSRQPPRRRRPGPTSSNDDCDDRELEAGGSAAAGGISTTAEGETSITDAGSAVSGLSGHKATASGRGRGQAEAGSNLQLKRCGRTRAKGWSGGNAGATGSDRTSVGVDTGSRTDGRNTGSSVQGTAGGSGSGRSSGNVKGEIGVIDTFGGFLKGSTGTGDSEALAIGDRTRSFGGVEIESVNENISGRARGSSNASGRGRSGSGSASTLDLLSSKFGSRKTDAIAESEAGGEYTKTGTSTFGNIGKSGISSSGSSSIATSSGRGLSSVRSSSTTKTQGNCQNLNCRLRQNRNNRCCA